MKEKDFAVKYSIPYIGPNNQSATKDACKFLIYGQNGSPESRYLVGNAFLRNYYVMLNYTDPENQHIGFNGDYWEVAVPAPKPKIEDQGKLSPLILILIIAVAALLFIAIGVCICIKKRNNKL